MNLGDLDLVVPANGAIDAAMEDILTRLLAHLRLEASNLTSEALFQRFVDIALASITIANILALIGAIFFVATLLMRTMVPLRVTGIISDVFFIGYGVLSGTVTTLMLYILLLPINIFRLAQMLRLVKRARVAAQGDLSMDWLKPFMTRRKYGKGDVLFRKGDRANEMFFTVTGKFLVTELGIELPPGRLVGELGFLAPDNRRTQSLECTEDGQVLAITYDRLLEIYFQNPEFGYYFLRLSTERLLQNITRLEGIIDQYKAQADSAKENQADSGKQD
ncbi:MAG TPA: cyclic nucleotide-binding domain-containing protein [Xanthobacteraceae bacterium]|nr:cyclic nucleotide-binding domain-containing protein [Xanthobacteraceae bacterium]